MWETEVQSLGQEAPLEEGMTTHSSILVWRILIDRGAWQATVHGVSKSQTRLKQLSMHSHCGLPWWLSGKESAYGVGDLGSVPGLGRSLGGGHDNPLQYSGLENPHGQRSLAG